MHSVFQTGFLGLWGNKVDSIDHHESEIEKLSKEVSTTPLRVLFFSSSSSSSLFFFFHPFVSSFGLLLFFLFPFFFFFFFFFSCRNVRL